MYFFGSNPGHPGEYPLCTLGQLFEQTRLSSNATYHISRGSVKEHFCEIILKADHWPKRKCCLNVFFSIFSSGGHFVQPSGTILAYLVECYSRNISVKLFENWSIGQGVHVDII